MPCFETHHVSAVIGYLGDTICDDQNNFSWCDYDHGDCCLGPSQHAHSFCNECLCKSNETNYPITFETQPSSQHDCLSDWIGD